MQAIDKNGRTLRPGWRVQISEEKVTEMQWKTATTGTVVLCREGARCAVWLDDEQLFDFWPSDLELGEPNLAAEKAFEEHSGALDPSKREDMRTRFHDHEFGHFVRNPGVPKAAQLVMVSLMNRSPQKTEEMIRRYVIDRDVTKFF